jgi:hypothetical protein
MQLANRVTKSLKISAHPLDPARVVTHCTPPPLGRLYWPLLSDFVST